MKTKTQSLTTLLFIALLLCRSSYIIAGDAPKLVLTGTVTQIQETTTISKKASFSSLHTLKSLVVSTPDDSNDPSEVTPDYRTSIIFIGSISEDYTSAEISTHNGTRWVNIGDVVKITAHPCRNDLGLDADELLFFVATIEPSELSP